MAKKYIPEFPQGISNDDEKRLKELNSDELLKLIVWCDQRQIIIEEEYKKNKEEFEKKQNELKVIFPSFEDDYPKFSQLNEDLETVNKSRKNLATNLKIYNKRRGTLLAELKIYKSEKPNLFEECTNLFNIEKKMRYYQPLKEDEINK